MSSPFATATPVRIGPDWFTLAVTRQNCLGPQGGKHLSGGAAMAAAIRAAEAATSRFVISAAGRFVGSPAAGETATYAVTSLSEGRSYSHVTIASEREGRPLLHAHATLAATPSQVDPGAPCLTGLPAPDACVPLPFVVAHEGDQHTLLDIRQCPLEGHHLAFWVAVPQPLDVGVLALVADYLPEAVQYALGRPVGALSFDNSLQVVGLTEADWLLCAIRIGAIAGRVFHGEATLYDQAGAVLAIAHQSGLIREFKPEVQTG